MLLGSFGYHIIGSQGYRILEEKWFADFQPQSIIESRQLQAWGEAQVSGLQGWSPASPEVSLLAWSDFEISVHSINLV